MKNIWTAGTDGCSIYWNSAWVIQQSDSQLRFALLHETLHCAHQHFWRLPMNAKGNIAGDHAINLTLLQLAASGADIAMPKGGVADPQYTNMAEEEILMRLPEKLHPGEQLKDNECALLKVRDNTTAQWRDRVDRARWWIIQNQPFYGALAMRLLDREAPPPSDNIAYVDACGGWSEPDDSAQGMESEELRGVWTQAVIQAELAAKAAQGTIPGDMQRIIAEAKARRIDWRREMADFVRDAISVRKDWARSSRRHATAPCIYPRRRADEIGLVVFARDTSGSVSECDLGMYNAAIEAATAETGCTAIIFDCDTRIRAEYRLEAGQAPPITAKGGGGTDFRPVFDRIAELDEPIAGIVYMTDLYGELPSGCEAPTLWLVSGAKRNVPFGRVVEIDQ